MNNIPENKPEALEEEFSTVFSAPTEHKKSAENVKRKKRLPIVIASFLAVAVLISGTVAVIKLIPEKEDETQTPSTPAIEEIKVLTLKSNEFKTVTVTNANGSFKLYSVEDKKETSESSQTEKTVTWYMEGFDKDLLNSYSLNSIVDSLADITASREVTERTAADCGLVKPAIKADIVTNEGKQITVFLGSESPDKSGYYLKLSDSDKIYVVDTTLKDTINFTAVSLANTNALSAFPITNISSKYKGDDGTLASCDKITVTGKNFSEPLVIIPNDDTVLATYAAFKVISPTKRVADKVEQLFEIFKNGVVATGAYSLDVKPKTLASFGLNSPDFTAKMEIEGKSHTFKFKLQADGNYAAVCDGEKLVKMVTAETLPFINYQTHNFYADWVSLNYIDNLKAFTFKVGDKAYTFNLAPNPDEESDDKYIVHYNGKQLKSSPFQDFYQECISLNCSDYTIDKVSGKPEYSLIYTFKDDIGGNQTVEFTKFSETKYQYTVDGKAMGKVTISAIKELENSLKALIK